MLFSESFFETMTHELLMTFLVAMAPVIELRGAIPAGIASGLPPALACIAAVAGNLVPAPFIILLGRRVVNWLRGTRFLGPKIVWLERRAGGFCCWWPSPCRGPGPGPEHWWPRCWISGCAMPCPLFFWGWSSRQPSPPPSPWGYLIC